MAEESAVKVCVRVRPLIEREQTAASEASKPVQLYWIAEEKSIHQVDDGNITTKSFSFDRVFSADETTKQLYQDIAKPLVVSTVEGYNGTIFAYGQTSSGKTHTMMGSDHIPGVIPLAMAEVFETIKSNPKKEFLLRVSYMEIYNETVTDLLVDSWKRKPLEVRETINKNIYVADLTEELVTSPAQALAWIGKGEKNRHYGKTKMNQRSSRSHTIFRMILESRERSDPLSGENADGAIIVSHLNLVDLAGSERASQTGAEGARFKEGCNINKSLFTLGQVIKKLSDESQRGFTNYRDSKLTRILQNSLGGNAKTVIICTITPVAIEETLSTLQFASTAKNMKNDPHVTEVSDDGALLKRYRNEIVDLKRRLQEVSTVTHNTVTEKETLSQILQEKDQLQREQEDRIKNLTKLLVTSANFVPIKKDPKRRVTWGGKLPSFAQSAICGAGLSDLSFVEPFHKRRKANLSTLADLGEDDEEFDSNWELPDIEANRTSGTVQSFEDSSVVFVSPNRELSDKLSQLEKQLDMEVRQKDEVTTKLETLDRRLEELTVQLETETQQKQEAVEKVEMLQNRLAEVDEQLAEQTQAQPQPQAPNEDNDQLRKEYAEAIQLCEAISTEKESLVSELEYLKQELGMFIEHTDNLEKDKTALSDKLEEKVEYITQLERDKTALSRELEERKEMDEFKSLEDACEKDFEKELQNEISRLKECLQSTEQKCQKLEANLESMSEELKKKSDWVEELETLNDKDLAQQVKQLRRSLDDAEGLSRETKKEWAFLRSENIALKERDVTLTTSYEKMEADVGSLRVQLESEKNRFKKMQTDLQKELQGAFHENTKLTTLLDGKVPKDLIDSVVLERTVADLKKELAASQVEEGTLRNQLEELKPLQNLPDKVNDLMKQVCELTETLCAVETQRDSLLTAQTQSQEQAQHLEEALQIAQDEVTRVQEDLKTAELREQDLNKKCADTTELLETLRSDLELATSEKSQLLESVQESSLKLNESDLQQASLEEKLSEMQQLVKDLGEKLADSELLRSNEEEIGKELQEQLDQLTEGLQKVEAERDGLLSEKMSNTQTSSEEMEKLLSTVTCLTEERDQLQEIAEGLRQEKNQLKEQLEENMEMLVQTQMEQIQQQPLNSELQAQDEQLSLLKHQLSQLTEDLESVRAERDGLHSEKTAHIQKSAEELEQLQSQVTCLTEERDQLKMDLQENVEIMIETQEELRSALEKTRKQKEQIKHLTDAQTSGQDRLNNDQSGVQLEELQNNIKQITEDLHAVQAERDGLLSRMQNTQASSEEMEKLLSKVTCLTEERDQLQEIVEGLKMEKNQLKEQLEENMEMAQIEQNQQQPLNSELQEHDEQVSLLQQQLNETEQQRASAEHKLNEMQQQVKDLEDRLADSELTRTTEEEIGKELQEQLTADLESLRAERDHLLSEKTSNTQTSSEEMAKLLSTVTCLTEERDQLQQIVEGLRQEKNQLKEQLEENMEMVQFEQNQHHPLNSELQMQDETVSLLQQQVEELSATLNNVTEQKKQLESDLQRNMEMASESEGLLSSVQEELKEQKQINLDTERQSQEKESNLQQQINTLTEEIESLRAEKDSLLPETMANTQTSSEEMEKLLSTVTCLTEERDQLQQIVEGLRQEKNQLKEQLEENMEMAQTEQNQQLLNMDLQAHNKEVSLLQQQAVETEGLLDSVREELKEQKQIYTDMERQSQEKESYLQQQINTLTEELQTSRAEKDSLLSETMANTQNSSEEMERLLSTVTCLTEERDQLQQIVEGLRQEKNQLKEQLEENMEMAQTEQNQQQLLNSELQARSEQVTQLQQQMEQINYTVHTLTERKNQLEADLQRNMEMAAETEESLHTVQEELKEQKQVNADMERQSQDKESCLQQQINTLTEELQSSRAEKDSLLSETTANTQNSSEEMEKLLSTVTCLTEERDQLQQIVEGLKQEKNQLKEQLEENMEMAQTEQNQQQHLNAELQARSEQVTQLQQQMEQIRYTVQTLTEKKNQLEVDLQRNMETAAATEGLVDSIQEELKQQKQSNSDMERRSQEKESYFQQKINTLTEDLQSLRTEKDSLLSEMTANTQTSSEEMEKLQSTVTCLTEERDQLQQIVEGMRQEKNLLKEQLEENMEKVLQMRKELSDIREERNQLQRDLQDSLEKVNQIQELLKQLQVEREQQEIELKKQVQQLEEELIQLKETQLYSASSEKPFVEELDEVNAAPTVPKEELGGLEEQNKKVAERGLSLRLQDSTLQLQESFRKFQHFVDICSNYSFTPMDNILKAQRDLMYKHSTTLPVSTVTAYNKVNNQTDQIITTLRDTKHLLKCYALEYKLQFEQLVQSDLAVFEERRVQDVLLCRAQAPSYSVKEEDFQEVWDSRLSEMLDKRETYLQKMDNVLERLWASMATYPSSLSEELRDRKMFNEELRLVFTNQQLDLAALDSILSSELDRCTAVVQSKEMTLEGLCEEHRGLTRDLEQLTEQGVAHLTDQQSRTATLLQMLDGVPVKTEVDLLKDNQQLSLQLQQSEKEVEALNLQIEQLSEEQTKAKDRVSNHKQATQLLQTELQDACAQVQEKEGTILALQGKLRESEANAKRNASPSAVELEELRAKVVKMELKLTTASSKYEEEIQRMTTVLKHKEEALRKLKETLRESQNQEEESFLQGKNLYSRLTQPKGHTVQSSVHTEKTKLEEEVKQLKLKIEELESLVSSQQAEIGKWKSRATKLKEKGKVVLDKPPSPCTPTKRRLAMPSESSLFLNSPKKLLDSAKVTSLLNSPKSKFFDVQPDSESLSKRPKQFFDNASLGTSSDKPAVGENNEWWPLSPKQADVCKTQ